MNWFFMVWNPEGRAPTHKHMDREAAQAEAERLARLVPGHQFFVLKAVSVTERNDVKTTYLDDPEVPF